MKKTIEIDDTLQDCVDSAIEGVKQALLDYLQENMPDELPDIGNDLDYSGAIHGIVDGSVPIYTKEINDIFYLHGDEVEEAFDNAGIGEKQDGQDGFPCGWKAAAIYCYIDQQAHDWYRTEAEEVFTEWKEQAAAKS